MKPNVQLVVSHLDGQTCYYPANAGWRVDPRDRCLVIGRGLPRKHIPLDTVASFDIEPARPTIVVLCGSTRFRDEFHEENRRLTLAGCIVLAPGVFGHAGDPAPSEEEKRALDELHFRKIDLADRVVIINPGGYVGDSTRREIDYAISHGKVISWLEPGTEDTPEAIAERGAALDDSRTAA